jgi:hypothetical protein
VVTSAGELVLDRFEPLTIEHFLSGIPENRGFHLDRCIGKMATIHRVPRAKKDYPPIELLKEGRDLGALACPVGIFLDRRSAAEYSCSIAHVKTFDPMISGAM